MNIRLFEIITRLSFFIVYFWFGLLKVLDLSSATNLVNDLAARTIPFISPEVFFFILGAVEMLIGIMFLIRKVTKLTIFITFAHVIASMLPFLVLPQHTWNTLGVLSMEGQYILKNLFILSGLIGLYSTIPTNGQTSRNLVTKGD